MGKAMKKRTSMRRATKKFVRRDDERVWEQDGFFLRQWDVRKEKWPELSVEEQRNRVVTNMVAKFSKENLPSLFSRKGGPSAKDLAGLALRARLRRIPLAVKRRNRAKSMRAATKAASRQSAEHLNLRPQIYCTKLKHFV